MKLCKTFVSQVQIQNNLCKSFSYHRCETRFRQPSVTWSEAPCDPFLALPWWRLRIMEKFSQKVGGKNRWYIATSLSLSLFPWFSAWLIIVIIGHWPTHATYSSATVSIFVTPYFAQIASSSETPLTAAAVSQRSFVSHAHLVLVTSHLDELFP